MNISLSELNNTPVLDPLYSKEYYDQSGLPLRIYTSPLTIQEEEREKQLLSLNGIHTENELNRLRKKYRLFICQRDCFALFEWKSRRNGQPLLKVNTGNPSLYKWQRINHTFATKEMKKILKLAARALYILGYDLGMVEISVFRDAPRYCVTKLSSRPLLSKRYESLLNSQYDKTVKWLQEESIKEYDPILGADLEFVLRHASGKYVVASKYFSKDGEVGYDSVRLRGQRNQYPLAELRPKPSSEPQELLSNIYTCMLTAIKKINNRKIEWLAGGQPLKSYPIGGHIHFSKVPLTMKLIRALDNYLTLPLFLLESETSLSRRPKYGFIGDYREQFHGGFEYRTPPSWIVSPRIAIGVLSLAKVIASNHSQLTWMPLNNYDIQEAFLLGDKQRIFPVVLSLWEALRRCNTYTKYKQYLDSFFRLIENRETWDEYADIRKEWRLPPFHKQSS